MIAKSTINTKANTTRAQDKAPALPGPRAKTGRPTIKHGKERNQAAAASTLMIPCPTPLEMPMGKPFPSVPS
jgi:hypothetical protein